mgnify:CR=1 FL=1
MNFDLSNAGSLAFNEANSFVLVVIYGIIVEEKQVAHDPSVSAKFVGAVEKEITFASFILMEIHVCRNSEISHNTLIRLQHDFQIRDTVS